MDTLGEAWREDGALGIGGVLPGGGVLRGCFEGLDGLLALASAGGCCPRFRDLPFCCVEGFCSGGVAPGVAALDCPGVLAPTPGLFFFTGAGALGAGSFPLLCLQGRP